MSERIRIDSADVARAPEVRSGPQRAGGALPVHDGEVFGMVSPSQATQIGPESGGIWAKPKFLFAVAGLAAAVVASILADGIGGFNRAEVAGKRHRRCWRCCSSVHLGRCSPHASLPRMMLRRALTDAGCSLACLDSFSAGSAGF